MAAHPLPVLSVPVRLPQVSRILVPVDFSDGSLAALGRAIEVARMYHSSIVLAHVMAHETSTGMATMLPGAVLDLEMELEEDLAGLRKLVLARDVPCTMLLRQGPVAENIRELVAQQKIDLLVLATHGGPGVHGILLGSTAERLIRGVTVPVLTVGSARNQPVWDERGARHILFAGDFTPETLCGLSLALGIAQTTDARISVAQVVARGTPAETVRAIREHIAELMPAGTEIHTPEGRVGATVCQLARRLGVGLVALGVHRSSLARKVFGTGLLEILLNAPCPVLSLRQCE